MTDEEIKEALEEETDPWRRLYLLWLLNGDGFYSNAEQNGAYY